MSLIAIAGDWHGDLGWAIATLRAAKEAGASILLQVGDFGASWPGPERHRFSNRLNLEAEKLDLPVVFIRGNHDNVDAFNALPVESDGYAKLREMIYYLPDGSRMLWQGTSIGGLGGATSSDSAWRLEHERVKRKPRTLWWPEEPVDRHAAIRLAQGGPLDVLLSHEQPAGPWFEKHYGDRIGDAEYLRSAMLDREIIAGVRAKTSPLLHVFGHHHMRRSLLAPTPGSPQRLEGMGMNGDRPGNLLLFNTRENSIFNPEVKWGRKA